MEESPEMQNSFFDLQREFDTAEGEGESGM